MTRRMTVDIHIRPGHGQPARILGVPLPTDRHWHHVVTNGRRLWVDGKRVRWYHRLQRRPTSPKSGADA